MVLEVEHLVKTFGAFRAVDDISFSVAEGEILGFLGPNGAGKTTTLHLILDLVTPTSGAIIILGRPLKTERSAALQDVGFSSPYVSLPYRLTVLENLKVFAHLFGVERPTERIDYLLKLFQIEDLKKQAVAQLSSGQVTRVGLCKAFLNSPKLLLLDEATASLDPQIAHEVREVLLTAQREEGVSILYTSHNMAEVEKMCPRVIFLNHGRIVAEGSPVDITRAILKEEREEPALEEVFFHMMRQPNV
ncbi:MAG: ABC transporter ATP-binding protein [Patescibacteria group bacterium]|jgi:ABC-2 type transport system ATP-binding protein